MPIATPTTIDPLKSFIAGASSTAGRPIPLVSTRFDVDIDGGLATVATKRVFRNGETQSIEAAITFPVPVHAVLFSLEARIDGRVMKARAQKRTRAREAYEDAVERGKTAVLHEEVLRGVHMLSVAHLGPGKEIEVTTTWVSALSFVGDRGQIRIPLTVGDIYGRSGLPDSDDLVTGGPVQTGDLFVRCKGGIVEVGAARLNDGHTCIALNAPIDLFVANAAARELRGLAADGREVVLRISPGQAGETPLNVAVLVDHSGSMDEICSHRTRAVSKHQAIVNGLNSVAQNVSDADVADLWEFDDQLKHVGPARPNKVGRERLLSLIARLHRPSGGTEIGAALAGTIAGSGTRDILLITDGKSHALDVHELARRGRRISVVLVGEDSLEANVGHLAALSGGDIFVSTGDDIADFLAAAIGALRAPSGQSSASPDRVQVVRGNAILEAEWRPAAGALLHAAQSRSVAAMAASLALPMLDEQQAAALAEAEGLVTHLTSLVLVDEAGEVQEGVPATRKVALPVPMASMDCLAMPPAPAGAARYSFAGAVRGRVPPPVSQRMSKRHMPVARRSGFDDGSFDDSAHPLFEVALAIDWDSSPNQLLTGDLSALDPEDALLIRLAAARPEIVACAKQFNLDPVVLIVALLARSRSAADRSAARIAKASLGDRGQEEDLTRIAELLGLH